MTNDLAGKKHNESAQRRDVDTILNYYQDPSDGSPPTPVYVGGDTVINERPVAPTQVVVHDMSGEEDEYTLDVYGFQLLRHKSKEKTFDNEQRIREQYYKECEEVYKNVTGASQAHLFGHLVRRGPTHWHTLGAGNASRKGPLHRVHIDQSYTGAELVLLKQVPDLAESILASAKRWQIINLWRPITTIYKDPLAVASAFSIPESDLIEAQVIYIKQAHPLNRSVTWTLLPNSEHQWYVQCFSRISIVLLRILNPLTLGPKPRFYKNEQKPDEVLMIKCYDSWTKEGLARRAPHCAFKDPERDGEEWGNRESIEIRAVVVYDE